MRYTRRLFHLHLLLWALIFMLCEQSQAQSPLVISGTSPVTEGLQDPYRSELFRVQGVPALEVHTLSGNIEVVHNPEIEGVQVDLFVSRGFSLWSGRRSLDDFRIILQQRGDRIIASVENRRSGRDAGEIQFHFVIQVPHRVSTNLRNLNGEIWLEGVEGSHFLQNESGGMRIRRSAGEIQVASTSGNLELEQLTGQVHARTVSGHIQVSDNEGEIRLRTVSGNVNATNLTGALVAATTSGNIDASFDEVLRGVYAETVSGNIRMALPSESGFQIQAKARGFDFNGLDQSELTEETRRQGEASVIVRGGGTPVNLTTVSGRITVTESQ